MAIDGNSIVNRAFYGIRMLNAPDGTPTNGIYGFITILQRLLDEEKPDAVCAAFDLKGPTFRHEQYEGYKAQRKGMPDDLAVQMPLLKETLDAMGILRLELQGWEADDLLGTVSRICEKTGDECVIVTGDKDSFQLITDRTRVLHVKSRMGQTETINYTPDRFREEYGFEPEKMVDLKALMGDTSDNIPGVPGCGEKTAMTLIQTLGSLEGVYANLDNPVIKPAMKKKLEAGEDSAKMSFDLATIRCNAPIEFEPMSAKWSYDFRSELYGMFMRLGFTKFIEKYKLSPTAEDTAAAAEVFTGDCTTEMLVTDADVAAAVAKCPADDTVYFTFEDGLDYVVFQRDCTAWVLSRDSFAGDYTKALRSIFTAPFKKAGHKIKDTLRSLLAIGIDSENWVFDSALAAYLLDSTAGSYDINRLCVRYCGFEPWTGEGEESGQMSLLDTPDEGVRASRLAAEGAAIACLQEKMVPLMAQCGMERLYYDIEL